MNLDGIDPVEFGEALSKLPPDHPLVSSTRVAVEVSDARRAAIETSHDVSAGWTPDAGATDARGMWAGRAETDGQGSRAAAKAAELSRPTPPEREAVDPDSTATAVRWAREWAAERAAQDAADDRAAEQACARHAAEAATRDLTRNHSSDDDYHAGTREMTHA